MKATYTNRYGDLITFTDLGKNKVKMSGYSPNYVRVGYAKDYSDAYDVYCMHCASLEEPDMSLLTEEPSFIEQSGVIRMQLSLRTLTYQEFCYEMKRGLYDKKHPFHNKYDKFVKLDEGTYSVYDPSGGPYISTGLDVGRYFEDNKKRVVEEIHPKEDHVIFIVSNG